MEHYFSEEQTSEMKQKKMLLSYKGKKIELMTSSGVFSKDKVDLGTIVLIDNMIIKKDKDVLDIGCGYGVVGVVAAKFFSPKFVLMTDVNERAITLSEINTKLNMINNAKIRKSFLFENIKEKFDVILTNPPQTAGKKICFKLIEDAKEHLKKGGTLQLVARHRKGGKSLAEKMKEVFGNVTEIAKKAGYRVYSSEV